MNIIDIILIIIIAILFIGASVKVIKKIICARNGNGCAGCLLSSSCPKKKDSEY